MGMETAIKCSRLEGFPHCWKDTQWELATHSLQCGDRPRTILVGEIPNGMLGVVEGGGHLNFSCEASHRDFRGDR